MQGSNAFSGGTTAATPAGLTDQTGAVNYNLTNGSATGLTGSVSLNTVRLTNGSANGVLDVNGYTLTANGIMNAGNAALTIQNSGEGGGLVIGANQELVVFSNSQGINISAAVQDNGNGPSALTYHGLGGGTLPRAQSIRID